MFLRFMCISPYAKIYYNTQKVKKYKILKKSTCFYIFVLYKIPR